MTAAPRIEENARLIDDQAAAIGMNHGKLASAQHVQMADIVVVVSGDSTEAARIEDPGRQREVCEEGSETICFDTLRH